MTYETLYRAKEFTQVLSLLITLITDKPIHKFSQSPSPRCMPMSNININTNFNPNNNEMCPSL